MSSAAKRNRLKKEIGDLSKSPPPGTSFWCQDSKLDIFEADVIGAESSPYQNGIFRLEIKIPDRYPFEPPIVKFRTSIYHPNIDNSGRICLDVLKLPPKGSWKPTYNIATILTSVQLLMVEPNPNDPLMADIAEEFIKNKPMYIKKAEEWTNVHAMKNTVAGAKQAPSNAETGGCENSVKRKTADENNVIFDEHFHSKRTKNEV